MAPISRLSFALRLFLIICAAVAAPILGWGAVDAPLHFDPVLWNTTEWEKTPAATWGEPNHLTREVYYEGDSFEGKPTRIFAYYGCPEGKGPFPAVVLVHGGKGKAFQDWAEHWAERGYVSLAMDLSGNGPAGRLPDGGPDQNEHNKFRDFTPDQAADMWSHQMVGAVIRGHSLLLSRPEVDPTRTALTGISWGGYLACIVAGLDHRFKAAVPVYGCGFLDEDSFWVTFSFAKMTPAMAKQWSDDFDPSHFLGSVQCPMLFVDGSNDTYYPADSLQKSYRLVKAPVTLSMLINRPHSHIWTFGEVDAFIDTYLNKGVPLPRVGELKKSGDTVSTSLSSTQPIAHAELDYTTDTGVWQKRVWKEAPATVTSDGVSAPLPEGRPMVCYLRVTDTRGLAVTTPHIEISQESGATAK
jgi:dienelactone hydrolase